jgi:hypothetical protein
MRDCGQRVKTLADMLLAMEQPKREEASPGRSRFAQATARWKAKNPDKVKQQSARRRRRLGIPVKGAR